MKNEKRKFSISLSKNLAKNERIIQKNLENRIKTLEQTFKNEEDFYAYDLCKIELENIYDKKAKGKSPRHGGLTKEFYEHFWGNLKFYFINSLKQAKI